MPVQLMHRLAGCEGECPVAKTIRETLHSRSLSTAMLAQAAGLLLGESSSGNRGPAEGRQGLYCNAELADMLPTWHLLVA